MNCEPRTLEKILWKISRTPCLHNQVVPRTLEGISYKYSIRLLGTDYLNIGLRVLLATEYNEVVSYLKGGSCRFM